MVVLYRPEREDLWFRRAFMADPATMSYNDFWGGTIPFPEEEWEGWFDHWLIHDEGKRFYRYLVDAESGEFVGEVCYHFDEDDGIYLMGVIVHAAKRGRGYGRAGLGLLCQAAKEGGISALYDDIAIGNPAISLFLSCGFVEDHRMDELIYLRKDL